MSFPGGFEARSNLVSFAEVGGPVHSMVETQWMAVIPFVIISTNSAPAMPLQSTQ